MGVSVKIDTSGLKSKTESISTQLKGNLRAAVQEMGDTIGNAAKQKAPYLTGTLRDSIQTRNISVSGFSASGEVGPSDDVPYALIQEKGGWVPADDPYIYPVTKKALAFDGGVFVRVKRHYIPAHPYMVPAYEQEKENAKQAAKRILLAGIE